MNALQNKLDTIIDKYFTTIVWNWYIDIIITRDNCWKFIDEISGIWIPIEWINWWCFTSIKHTHKYWCPHWWGWPQVKWWYFSEMYADIDYDYYPNDIKLWNIKDTKKHNEKVKKELINKKIVGMVWTTLNYKDNPCLTPWFYLKTPNNWKNKYDL